MGDGSNWTSLRPKAKGAHDELIAKAHRAQADALEIEAMAKRRLADEYDAAQERGEVRTPGGDQTSKAEVCGPADIGLTHKEVDEARQMRDAEVAQPGVVRQVLDDALSAGREPTKANARISRIESQAFYGYEKFGGDC